MRKLLLIGMLATAIVAGCSKTNDPDPDDTGTGTGTGTTGTVEKKPTSCLKTFETKPEYVKNSTIGFTNCSKDASTYLWNFGDGETSTDKEPTHAYKTNGSYTVKLYAYSANKTKVDSNTMTVIIGDKYITKIVLSKFSDKTPDNLSSGANEPWDSDGTGPDWALTFSPGKMYDFMSSRKRTTVVKSNVATGTSVEWTTGYVGMDPSKIETIDWQITNEPWSYQLTEVDGTTYNFTPGLDFNDKNLLEERFNPIILSNNDYKIELHWTIKNK